ncbi:hypothetical protein [Daejeonella lutea]|uniref:Uncharacterized protein n=1 Tax=Daejeonella lutea TaxID=572036 RepID=A0A1T4ZWP1_9SPHI|nr:hypothetical protein [Daejeonella lutea]SKB27184.1 hypothetical protein SAMN05661099_0027 [Daejeonella lutea]
MLGILHYRLPVISDFRPPTSDLKSVFKLLSAFYFLTLIGSCGRPDCKNTNPVFNAHAPQTKVYKGELAKQLKLVDKSKLSYWVALYQENDHRKYIHAYIQGDGLCAVIVFTIKDSQQGIEGILRTKGKSYGNARLTNVKFDVVQDNSNTEFVFKSLDSIID